MENHFTLQRILNPSSDNQRLLALSLKELLNDIHTEKTKYRATDSTDMRCFGFRLLQKIRKLHPDSISTPDACELLKKTWHITSSIQLAELFIRHKDKLKGFKTGPITGTTNKGSAGRMNKKEQSRRINKLNLDTAIKAMKRAVVCRSQFGNYDIRFYEITESLSTDKGSMLNAIKSQYKEDTGCPYYQVRPILMSTWLTLPEYQQYCTAE